MKQAISLSLILCLCLALSGCDDDTDNDLDGADTEDTSEQPTDLDSDTRENDSSTAASLCRTEDAACAPGSFMECDDLGDPELLGHLPATCLDDCSGYDTSLCLSPEEMLPYGEVSVNLAYEFILDANQIGDVDYQDAHLHTIVTETPVFQGRVGGVDFPPTSAVDYEILVLRTDAGNGGQLAISQQGFDAEGKLVNPSMHLKLPGDHYRTGDAIEVCLGQQVIIYFYDLNPATFAIDCFHAVTADGILEVDLAEDLGKADGGKISLSSPEPLITYYMKNTPHGDLSETLDYPVCARSDEGGQEGEN